MAAFVIATRETTRDFVKLESYKAAVGKSLAKFEGELLANQGQYEVLEGHSTEGVTLLKFPTYEDALAWYRSSEYQGIAKARLDGSDHRFIVVEGSASK